MSRKLFLLSVVFWVLGVGLAFQWWHMLGRVEGTCHVDEIPPGTRLQARLVSPLSEAPIPCDLGGFFERFHLLSGKGPEAREQLRRETQARLEGLHLFASCDLDDTGRISLAVDPEEYSLIVLATSPRGTLLGLAHLHVSVKRHQVTHVEVLPSKWLWFEPPTAESRRNRRQ